MFNTKTQSDDTIDVNVIDVIEPNLPDLFEVHVLSENKNSEFNDEIAFPDELDDVSFDNHD